MAHSIQLAAHLGTVPVTHVRVHAARGVEALSRLYRFDLDVTCALAEEAFERAVLGARAVLQLAVGGVVRSVDGVIVAITCRPALAGSSELHGYRVRLVPAAWLLGRRKQSRIFQRIRVNDAIDAVAHEARIATRWDLAAPLPERDYLTQYRETDLAFVRRLCAENGVYFWFEHAQTDVALPSPSAWPPPADERARTEAPPHSAEVWVFSDAARYPSVEDAAFPPGPAIVRFREPSLQGAEHDEGYVSEAATRARVGPNRAAFREYDPLRPLARLEARRGHEDGGEGGHELEIYEHDAHDLYPDWGRDEQQPERILRQRRRRGRVLRGVSSSVRLQAGRRFQLEDHPLDGTNGEHVVVALRHAASVAAAGDGATTYRNTFEAVPADVVYLPLPPEPRCVESCLTALVVGLPGEDIHVNERGEIKVKFHWDRRLLALDNSCWLRTMQTWAGASWGFQFVPRVGMEVVVGFDGGDPDKPLVLGCVNNGVAPPPFGLPRYKNKSGIVTRSTPVADGYHELSFDDTSGDEKLVLRAQRDLESTTVRDRLSRVGHDDRVSVGGARRVEVEKVLHTLVREKRDEEIGGDDLLHVAGRRSVRVDEAVDELLGARHTLVSGRDTLEIGGDAERRVRADAILRVDGNATALVGGEDAKRSLSLEVTGTMQLRARQVIDLTADEEIVLRCGTSFIRVASGEIEIGADKVSVRGKDARLLLAEGDAKLKVKSKAQVVSEDAIVLEASGASLGLKSQAKLDGSQVLLNSPEQASDDIQTSEPEPLCIELVDQDGNPLAFRPFRIAFEDGGEYLGFTDAAGKASVEVPGPGRITFPDLSQVEEA